MISRRQFGAGLAAVGSMLLVARPGAAQQRPGLPITLKFGGYQGPPSVHTLAGHVMDRELRATLCRNR